MAKTKIKTTPIAFITVILAFGCGLKGYFTEIGCGCCEQLFGENRCSAANEEGARFSHFGDCREKVEMRRKIHLRKSVRAKHHHSPVIWNNFSIYKCSSFHRKPQTAPCYV